jgi:hypothetical protein
VGAAAVLAVSVVALTACSSSAGGNAGTSASGVDAFGHPVGQPITRAELETHAGSHPFYPDSNLVRSVGSNQIANPAAGGPDPTYAGAILTASATAAQLYAFYEQELLARGFHTVNDYRLSSQVSGRAWEVDQRVHVHVGIFDPVLLQQDQNITTVTQPGELGYEVVLVGYSKHPSGDAVPSTSAGLILAVLPGF